MRRFVALSLLAALCACQSTPAYGPEHIVPCDTDSDCVAKNPQIPFGL